MLLHDGPSGWIPYRTRCRRRPDLSLFDHRAWWLPSWLDRIIPDVDVEGERLAARLAQLDAGSGSEQRERAVV